MRELWGFLSVVLLLCVTCLAQAVPPGEEVEFTQSPMGKATFDGRTHKENGLQCDDCHPAVFEEKAGSTDIGFDDHHEEKSCFNCHEASFREEGNCMTCHSL